MATLGSERELLTKGLEQDGIVRGVWAQNMMLAEGAISVRSGWGVEAELDTTMNSNVVYRELVGFPHIKEYSFGYKKHLGSALIKTDFGTKQVVSVFTSEINYGDLGAVKSAPSSVNIYVVRIYDLTTRQSWEEPLYRSTSQLISAGDSLINYNPPNSFPSAWFGCYESSKDVDNTTFLSSEFETTWFFHAFRGKLYFGSPSTGVFVYRPCDIQQSRSQQIENHALFDWTKGYSETALITPIHFMAGVHEDSFVYATKSTISKIVAMTSFRGRVAYATDYSVFFSDQYRPNNIIAINFINIPSKNPVTALYEFNGNLMIFTSKETYIYVPSEGTIISQGRPPIKISESVGCVGQQAVTLADNQLFWVSNSGVFTSSSGQDTKEVSEPIRAFWGGHGIMTNPMTSYYEANAGFANISTTTPPRTLLEFKNDRITLTYNHDTRTVMMGCPSLNGCWSFSGIWSWWPAESVVSKDALGKNIVSASQNLLEPWVMADDKATYGVFGVNQDSIPDSTLSVIGRTANTLPSAEAPPAIPTATPCREFNYVICKLGKGGALDRSSYREDYREASGKYIPCILPDDNFSNGSFVFEKPYYEVDTDTAVDRHWIQVSLVPPGIPLGGNPVQGYELRFFYDNTEWNAEPDAAANITLRFPTERSQSVTGITRARIEDAAGAADVNGSHIRIIFNGAAGAGWTHQPNLNLVINRENPLFQFSMKKITANSVAGFGIQPLASTVSSALATVANVGMLVWVQHYIGAADSHNDNAKVQAVDWAYKSKEESTGSLQLKARGIYAKMGSHGRGLTANRIVPNWVWGIYNVILGSDAKDYTTQVVDYDNDIQKIQAKVTIRSRFRDVNGAMKKRVFGSSLTETPQWGTTTDANAGNYLIDDEQTDSIATSDSIKGESISYMVFGFMQDRAESLGLLSLLGVFRPGGRRRRTGR